jgi:hypothetical protein
MYIYMCFHMVRTNIATKLDVERSFDIAGIFCDDNDAQGRTSNYKIDYPENVMFLDETGVNTNQGKYENIGGMKMLTKISDRTKERSIFEECH